MKAAAFHEGRKEKREMAYYGGGSVYILKSQSIYAYPFDYMITQKDV